MNKLEFKVGNLLRAFSEVTDLITSLEDLYKVTEGAEVELGKIADEPDNAYRSRLFAILIMFEEFDNKDIEESYLGYGIKVLTRERVVSIIKSKEEIYDNILKRIRGLLLEHNFHNGSVSQPAKNQILAKHYFLATSSILCFKISCNKDSCIVGDVFMVEIPRNLQVDIDDNYLMDRRETIPAPKRFRDIVGLEI